MQNGHAGRSEDVICNNNRREMKIAGVKQKQEQKSETRGNLEVVGKNRGDHREPGSGVGGKSSSRWDNI